MKTLLSVLVFLCSYFCSHTQEKTEYEVGIHTDSVPQKAILSVQQIGFTKGKWYKEYRISDFSFEYKTKVAGKHYSVEFDQSGNLEDVELLLKKKDYNPTFIEPIEICLEKDADKYKIIKIQRQWFPVETSDSFNIKAIEEISGPQIRYEFVVKMKVENALETWEYLFDTDLKLLRKLKIVELNFNHLEN